MSQVPKLESCCFSLFLVIYFTRFFFLNIAKAMDQDHPLLYNPYLNLDRMHILSSFEVHMCQESSAGKSIVDYFHHKKIWNRCRSMSKSLV